MLALTAGARFIGVTNDYRSLFDADNPQLAAFNAFENIYGATNTALIAVAPGEGTVFTRKTLGALEALTEAAWETPYSTRADSLANYNHTWAEEDDLIVEPLVDGAGTLSDEDIRRIEKIALAEPELVGRLVSRDGKVAGLAISFALPDNPDAAVVEITDYLEALLERQRAAHPDIAYHLTGDVPLNRAFADAT
ncbi:MAG: RND family transporter, partial [Rhodospirillaceae bacterium]|nr:RND family transporter [Rhodospirillaceae bacterium]